MTLLSLGREQSTAVGLLNKLDRIRGEAGKPGKKVSVIRSFFLVIFGLLGLHTIATASDSDKYNCEAESSWFDGSFDPKTAADNFKDSSNCAFHQFSWRTFIWLTEKIESGELRFESFYSDSAIFPNSKPGNFVLGGVHQAGSNGILVDQSGRAVYTTLIMNDIYRDFVLKHKLYTQEGMQDVDAGLNFPNGSMSLKAAWKIVQPGEDVSAFYSTDAPIQLLAIANDKVVIPENAKQVTAKVVLVGFHIAVYVNKHPEAIWATFEHKDNSPTFAKSMSPNKPVSDRDYTFYKAGTKAKDCNANNSGMNAILKLNPDTQVMEGVTQACLQFAQGTVDNQPSKKSAAMNRGNIISLNKNVHQLMAANSVWKNYSEVGAVWFTGQNALKPNWSPNVDASQLTGSTKLSNSTIETFTQNDRSQDECFSCHNTMSVVDTSNSIPILPGKNVNTSHILLKNYLNGQAVQR